jgi:hypothetical protein
MKFSRYLTILALAKLLTPEASLAQNNFTAPPLSITWVRTNPPVNGLCNFTALNQFNFTTGQYWGCLPLDNPSVNGFNTGGWKPIAAPEIVGYGAALPTFCTIGRIFYLTSAMAGANVYGCTALNTWTLQTGGSAGGTVTSVSSGCGLAGGPVTSSGTLSETIPVAAHNGSYSILTADCGKALTSNVAGTYTLPQAGSAGFPAGWHGYVQNVGGSGNVTVSTTTSTFYGNGGSGASGVLVPGSGVELVSDGTNWLVLAYTASPAAPPAPPTFAHSPSASFDGGGLPLAVGTKSYITVPYGCTIEAWDMTVDTGTATIDVWKIAGGTAIPTVANTITASALPAIASGTALHSTTLTAWTTAVTANDIFGFNISAVSGATKASLVLQCQQDLLPACN